MQELSAAEEARRWERLQVSENTAAKVKRKWWDKANFSRLSGKLSRKACPAGRQVQRAEQTQRGGGDQAYNFSNFFCLFCPFLLSVCLPLCNYTSCLDPVALFLFLSPSPLFDLPLSSWNSFKVTSPPSPLFLSLHNVLHLLCDHTCVPTQPDCSLTCMWQLTYQY